MIKYDSICLMVPTYKRLVGLARFIDTAMKFADDPKRLKFAFCVNAKDVATIDMLRHRYFPLEENVDIVVEETRQPNLSKFWNMLYDSCKFKDNGTLVSMVADDMEFCTKGWDTEVLKEFNEAEGKLILYCDDDYIAHDKLCVNLFTSRLVVDSTRKPFMCERWAADMVDVVWYFVGRLTGILKYRGDIVIRHNHASRQPDATKWDETAQRLSPIQRLCSSKPNHRIAEMYAHRCAMNMIDAGVGTWNII